MKRIIAVILASVLLLSVFGIAHGESNVEKVQRLLTQYTWTQSRYNYLYLTNSKDIYPNFRWLSSIHLPDSTLTLTGDETGKVYIVYWESTGYLGSSCPGEVSFSADEKTMLIAVVAGDLYGIFEYTRP